MQGATTIYGTVVGFSLGPCAGRHELIIEMLDRQRVSCSCPSEIVSAAKILELVRQGDVGLDVNCEWDDETMHIKSPAEVTAITPYDGSGIKDAFDELRKCVGGQLGAIDVDEFVRQRR
jgi:hypothetical protein